MIKVPMFIMMGQIDLSMHKFGLRKIDNCRNVVFSHKECRPPEVRKYLVLDKLSLAKISEGLCYDTLHYKFLVHLLDWEVYPTTSLPVEVQKAVKEHSRCVQVLRFEYCNGGSLRDFAENHLPRFQLQHQT